MKIIINEEAKTILNALKDSINQLLGFQDDTPRINYGPCGVFAQLFFEAWNMRLSAKVHICFVMTLSREECYHIVIRLPDGQLYDGGIGLHSDEAYSPDYVIDDMLVYNHKTLDKWAYGLERTYPRFCPNFDKSKIDGLINHHLELLVKLERLSSK